MTTTNVPVALGDAGRLLWDSISNEFEFDGHEAVQFEEACRVRDTIATLRVQLASDGTMLASSQGMRLHPAIAEIRAQQLTLARLLATLSLPELTSDELPSTNGVRGVYPIRRQA